MYVRNSVSQPLVLIKDTKMYVIVYILQLISD